MSTNGAPPRASSSTSELRQHYNAATRAFLVRDYALTASSLHDALALVRDISPRAWFDAVQSGAPVPVEVTLRRRLDVLQVTFLATVRSSPGALSPSPALSPLLDLPPGDLVKALWSGLLLQPGSPAHSATTPAPADILPTPAAAYLHPSLAVALVLAALKLDEPRLARAVADAWLGSVDPEVEALVYDTAGGIDWGSADAADLALDAVGGAGGGGTAGMGASFSGAPGQAQQLDPRRQLVAAWLRLLDLAVLHVLPRLGEWDAAGDLVRLQGVENGGWVPDERVEAALRRLVELQHEEAQLVAARAQRQKGLDAARAAASTSSAASKRRSGSGSGSGSDKGKSRAREGSPTDSGGSNGGSPNGKNGKSRRRAAEGSTPRPSPPLRAGAGAGAGEVTGFAGLRDSLSAYLAPRSSAAASASAPAPTSHARGSGPLRAFAAYLREHYTTDPVRVLSFVCFAFAVLTWTRRRLLLRRARGQRGLGVADAVRLVAARVGETVGMMTKVTAM